MDFQNEDESEESVFSKKNLPKEEVSFSTAPSQAKTSPKKVIDLTKDEIEDHPEVFEQVRKEAGVHIKSFQIFANS